MNFTDVFTSFILYAGSNFLGCKEIKTEVKCSFFNI